MIHNLTHRFSIIPVLAVSIMVLRGASSVDFFVGSSCDPRRGESHADGPEFTQGKADNQNLNYGKTVR